MNGHHAHRARLLYSAAWGTCPFRVYIGNTAVMHGNDRAALAAWVERFNSGATTDVLRAS